MTEEPKLPAEPAVTPVPTGLNETGVLARILAVLLKLLLRLPPMARYGLIAALVAGLTDVSGVDDAVLDSIFKQAEVEVHKPDRSHQPELRLERADAEALSR